MVIGLPTIGRVPLTVAAPASTATTAILAMSPPSEPVAGRFTPTVSVRVVPALTVKDSFKIAWWFEFRVLERPICRPSSSRMTTPLTDESCAGPCRSTVTEFTLTSPSAAAVSVNLVAGMRAAFKGAIESPGCAVEPTVKPVPVGGGGGVPGGGGGGGGGTPATRLSYLARLIEPKYPAVGETPFAACHFETAARVSEPKYFVSFPGDPEPLAATWKPAEFKYCCKHMTSSPLTPWKRLRVNAHLPAGACCFLRAFNSSINFAICCSRVWMAL